MALENSNGGRSFNNNLNGLYLKIKLNTQTVYIHTRKKKKSSVTGHSALKDFTCFDFLNIPPTA